MKSIIVSLISLFSVACYGAVDLEALKIKAAAYAQGAIPFIARTVKIIGVDEKTNRYKGDILRQIMTHATPLDIETDGHYDKTLVKEYKEDHKITEELHFVPIVMNYLLKESFRSALAANDSQAVAQVIRELCKDTTVDDQGNPFCPNDGYWGGLSPLHLALVTGQYDIALELIINHKADINSVAENGATPLMCVIDKAHHRFLPDLLRFMIEQGANPKVVFVGKEETLSAFAESASIKNFKAMQILEEEYNIHEPLLPAAQKAVWNGKADVGVMMHLKNGSTTNFEDIETVLAFKISLEEEEVLCVLPTKKIALHQDWPLLQAVNDKDTNLVAYMLNRWNGYIDPMDAFFAAIRALQTSQSGIMTLFKDHGLILNDAFSGYPITCDFDENNSGPHFFTIESQSQEEKKEIAS